VVSSGVGLDHQIQGVINISNQSFSALGVSRLVTDVLEARDMKTPFRIQELVIPDALAGGDLLAKAPTGSGKTIAFAVPIVERTDRNAATPAALVLVPTRELAVQVAVECAAIGKARDLRVAAVYGGAPLKAQANRAKGAHILVATPGRLQDLVERRLVSLERIQILVLDEADRMLDMGFKPQVERLVRRLPAKRQTMLFSATLDGEVGELAQAFTRNPSRFEAEARPDRPEAEVSHRFAAVSAEEKVERLVEELEADRGLALVFVRTKRGADRLVKKLARHDVHAVAMHGDMSQSSREQALARFRSGKVKTLVATDVAARGLDLVEITHVINFDPPEDDKGYVHRVGRTGRAGRTGNGVTFVTPEQQGEVSRVAARLGHREQFERAGMSTAPMRRVYTSRRGRRSKW
jgi:ATP-dependent RNA helicase RhlE